MLIQLFNLKNISPIIDPKTEQYAKDFFGTRYWDSIFPPETLKTMFEEGIKAKQGPSSVPQPN